MRVGDPRGGMLMLRGDGDVLDGRFRFHAKHAGGFVNCYYGFGFGSGCGPDFVNGDKITRTNGGCCCFWSV